MHGGGEDGVWMSMMRCSRNVLAGCAAVLACVRTAPAGEDHAGGALAWNFDPWIVGGLALSAWLLHAIVLWGWHFPVMFQASLKSDAVHTVQHLSFLVSALLFWAALIGTSARMRDGSAVLYILTTLIHTGMLGALLTFSSTVWYPVYAGRTEAWGLTVLEDQQLGGLIMWVPAGFVLLLAALAVAAKVVMPERAGGRHAD